MKPLRIGIAGSGRMGQAIAAAIDNAPDLELAGLWRRGEDLSVIAADADVLIDFSLPEAAAEVLAATLEHALPLVCGVSGLSEEQMQSLNDAATQIPIVFDRNMSQGIAVLDSLVRDAARALGDDFSVAIHETHHVHKKDAPSGTALKLGESIADALGIDAGSIHYESERRGEVPGDHSVVLASASETLTLSHSVTTRQVFADGALRAARWIAGRAPGRFTMHDVLE